MQTLDRPHARRGRSVLLLLAASALLGAGCVAQTGDAMDDPAPGPSSSTADHADPAPSATEPVAAPARFADGSARAAGCVDATATTTVAVAGPPPLDGAAVATALAATRSCAGEVILAPPDQPMIAAVAASLAAGSGAPLLVADTGEIAPGLADLVPQRIVAFGDSGTSVAPAGTAQDRWDEPSLTTLGLRVADHLSITALALVHLDDTAALPAAAALAAAEGRALVPVSLPVPPAVSERLAHPETDVVVVRSADARDLTGPVARRAAGHVDEVVADTLGDLLAAVADHAGPRPAAWVVDPNQHDPTSLAVVAAAAGATDALVVPHVVDDLRRPTPTTALRDHLAGGGTIHVLGPADALVADDDVAWQARTVEAARELPGGGQLLFPYRRFVALYGHPHHGVLGVLGEQSPQAGVDRVNEVASPYDTEEVPVQPAWEMITTLASSGPTPDGDYSAPVPIEDVRRWHEVARANGIYLVLDLQPGRTDFLTQAKLYEDLLREPDVGLALDPEWRLKPNQVHLRQIGSVDAAEVNQVIEWLAGIVREEALPQKLLIVHQFKHTMVTNRDQLLTPPELAVMVHVDGQGSLGAKYGTYDSLIDPGQRWWPGWKNFYDEDSPMATPAQVLALEPVPWFVSFQ